MRRGKAGAGARGRSQHTGLARRRTRKQRQRAVHPPRAATASKSRAAPGSKPCRLQAHLWVKAVLVDLELVIDGGVDHVAVVIAALLLRWWDGARGVGARAAVRRTARPAASRAERRRRRAAAAASERRGAAGRRAALVRLGRTWKLYLGGPEPQTLNPKP